MQCFSNVFEKILEVFRHTTASVCSSTVHTNEIILKIDTEKRKFFRFRCKIHTNDQVINKHELNDLNGNTLF